MDPVDNFAPTTSTHRPPFPRHKNKIGKDTLLYANVTSRDPYPEPLQPIAQLYTMLVAISIQPPLKKQYKISPLSFKASCCYPLSWTGVSSSPHGATSPSPAPGFRFGAPAYFLQAPHFVLLFLYLPPPLLEAYSHQPSGSGHVPGREKMQWPSSSFVAPSVFDLPPPPPQIINSERFLLF